MKNQDRFTCSVFIFVVLILCTLSQNTKAATYNIPDGNIAGPIATIHRANASRFNDAGKIAANGSPNAVLFTPIMPTPVLGTYPDTSLPLSTNITVVPSIASTNTTSINVSTSTNFKGKLEGDSITGSVRVTDAHPAGTYTVTVTAFDGSNGPTTTKTFTLTVTTPPTCNPVNFAATTFEVGDRVGGSVVGDFNGDGKQDLAVGAVAANFLTTRTLILLGDG